MKRIATSVAAVLVLCLAGTLGAQSQPASSSPSPAAPAVGITAPPDYVIGPGDILAIVYWRDKEMTGDQTVRPDGKITLPLLNDVDAAGLTTEQLRDRLTKASLKWMVDPAITVGVRTINSRKVFIAGGVQKPGAYDLLTQLDVVSLIALAGGLKEWTSGKNITILRTVDGKPTSRKFNYKEVQEGKNLEQNIFLRPNDRVLVPE